VSDCILSVNRIGVTIGSGQASARALSNVSLAFPAGVLSLVMGPSGSGKTTLLSVLGCLLRPQDGSVLVNGRDVTALTEDERTRIRREQIGFIFQSFRLFKSLTAIENVMLALEIAGAEQQRARSKAELLLEKLIRNLSGGYWTTLSVGIDSNGIVTSITPRTVIAGGQNLPSTRDADEDYQVISLNVADGSCAPDSGVGSKTSVLLRPQTVPTG
jgi:ABC-type taurine transport system ATPase subunit